jgi:integrase
MQPGLTMKPHTLRHTYASLLIEADESLKYVQERSGTTPRRSPWASTDT